MKKWPLKKIALIKTGTTTRLFNHSVSLHVVNDRLKDYYQVKNIFSWKSAACRKEIDYTTATTTAIYRFANPSWFQIIT